MLQGARGCAELQSEQFLRIAALDARRLISVPCQLLLRIPPQRSAGQRAGYRNVSRWFSLRHDTNDVVRGAIGIQQSHRLFSQSSSVTGRLWTPRTTGEPSTHTYCEMCQQSTGFRFLEPPWPNSSSAPCVVSRTLLLPAGDVHPVEPAADGGHVAGVWQ